MKPKLYKISEFSILSGLSIKALRIYERSGILVPSRLDGNKYRQYNEGQVALAREIVALKLTGFSLREIKALLPFRDQSNGGTLALLRQQLIKIEQTMAVLSEQCSQIRSLIKRAEKGATLEAKGLSGLFAKRLVCKEISESIKRLSDKQIEEKTRQISNEEYLRTVAMVDDVARAKLLSTISEKAVRLVKDDLAALDRQYATFWK